MNREEIVHTAIDNLDPTLHLDGKWIQNGNDPQLDGVFKLHVDDFEIDFYTVVKEELRTYQVEKFKRQTEDTPGFLVIAYRLFPGLKQKLRENQVNYLEANGNLFINTPDFKLFQDTNNKLAEVHQHKPIYRAYTPAGLRVLFELLRDPELLNQPQRDIAGRAGVAVGNIPKVLKGLQNLGHIYRLNKKRYVFNDRRELLHDWVREYPNTLKPKLFIGQFANKKYEHWKEIPLHKDQTVWGGEPAGEVLTNYLRPQELTLYTKETKRDLLVNYGLKPDPAGEVQVYKKFWNGEVNTNTPVAPAILTYADLINTNDKRCIETADKIYHEYIEPEL